MDTPELFPGESKVREMAVRAGWSPSTGNGWAAIFASPYNENVTLDAHAREGWPTPHRAQDQGQPPFHQAHGLGGGGARTTPGAPRVRACRIQRLLD